jgi:hypothetical protein
MHQIRLSARRMGCLVVMNGLLCATVGVESATAQPSHPGLHRHELPPALHINPGGAPPAQSPTRVPYSDVPPGVSVNTGGGAPQSSYSEMPFAASTGSPYTAASPSVSGNLSYVMSSICVTRAGNCATSQTPGTQCQCSDGTYLYAGFAQ